MDGSAGTPLPEPIGPPDAARAVSSTGTQASGNTQDEGAASLRPSTQGQPDPEPARITSDLPPDLDSLRIPAPVTVPPQSSEPADPEQRALDRRNAMKLALKRMLIWLPSRDRLRVMS